MTPPEDPRLLERIPTIPVSNEEYASCRPPFKSFHDEYELPDEDSAELADMMADVDTAVDFLLNKWCLLKGYQAQEITAYLRVRTDYASICLRLRRKRLQDRADFVGPVKE